MAPDPRKAIVPGSYDPVTYGHLDVIERAARLFDVIVIGVVNLPVRKGKTLFSAEERCGFIADATSGLGLDNVEVKPFSSLLVEFARVNDAKAIVKGLRAISDFEYEFEMNQLNRMQAPEIESVYLMSGPQYSFLSSSGVKELATFGGDIDDLVPPIVARRLKEELQR
jgi:pantetheine-phosphate adenylyltransferase